MPGLKATVREADETLGERLKAAEHFSVEMRKNAAAGADVLKRLAKIAGAQVMGAEPEEEKAPPPDTRSIVAAAQAFAERTRARVRGLAA